MVLNRQILMAGIGVSLIAVFPWPIGFYTFTRIVICGCAAYAAFYLFTRKANLWLLGAGLAVLYNPIIPIYLYSKALWAIINVGTAAFFFWVLTRADNE